MRNSDTGQSVSSPETKGPPAASRGQDASSTGSVRTRRILLACLLGLVLTFLALMRFAYVAPSPGRSIALDELYRTAQQNRVKSVKLLDEDSLMTGTRCLSPPKQGPPTAPQAADPGQPAATTPTSVPPPPRCYDQLTEKFHTSYPASQVVTQQLIEAIRQSTGATIAVDNQTPKKVAKVVVTFLLPLLLLANLLGLIFLTRGSGGSISEIAGFGRFRRKSDQSDKPTVDVTFVDVAGADEAVTELREVIDYLTDPDRFKAYGATPPKGVLLFGPPGCGKTLLARATAGESGVPFFSVSGTEFVESLVGVGAARVRDLFRQVREVAPAIVFIDEIDAVGRRRSGEGMSGGEREQTLNQLLVELDGFEVTSGIVLMGATNRPDILDPALLRPGRFDRHITIDAPAVEGRRAILELHAEGRPMGPDVDFAALAARTPGFTGADLANVINEAALLAIRQGLGTQINAALLSEAVLRVLHGPQRRGRLLNDEERYRLAVHEAGHALVVAATGLAEDLHRVSIVARGRGLSQSAVADGERAVLTLTEMEARLAMAMAGVAAEIIVFGEPSTSAQDDVARATVQARDMVGLYGMSGPVGPVRVLRRADGYLGGEDAVLDLVSGQTMAEFDSEVRRLILAAQASATEVLRSRRRRLDDMAAALVEVETLEGDALRAFLTGDADANGSGRLRADRPSGGPRRQSPRSTSPAP